VDLPARSIALAALSGSLSYAACHVPDWGTQWGAGVAFGLLVLGPTQRSAARFLALAALSVAVYRAAVWLAVQLVSDTPVPAVAACAFAGVLGAAALSLGASAVTRAGIDRGAAARAAAWGALGGALIGFAVNAPDGSLAQIGPLLAGFVVWQVGYTVSHRLAPWRSAAQRADGEGPLRTPA
jgi:hypothetical protein